MPRLAKVLTVHAVEKAHKARAKAILADGAAPGLYLRVGPLGSQWGAQVSGPTGRERVALGSYPTMGLGEAREAARRLGCGCAWEQERRFGGCWTPTSHTMSIGCGSGP